MACPPPLPAQGEGKSTKYENKVRALSFKIFTVPLYIISKAWTDSKYDVYYKEAHMSVCPPRWYYFLG